MSFVIAAPDLVQAAAEDLAGIRSLVDDVAVAAAADTTGVVPAAADEVSSAIAALFGSLGKEFQALYTQAAAFHDEFVNLLKAGAAAYINTEVANGAALLQSGGSLATDFDAGIAGLGTRVGGSLAAGLDGELTLQIGGSLGTSIGAGLGGVALRTGGALVSGVGAGLVRTGNAITTVGLALENSGALMSSAGAGLTAQAGGAFSAILNGSLTGELNATVSVGLNGAAFSALLHNAAGATGQLVTALHTELGAVVGTGETLAAHGALALHHLGAGVWAELPVVTGQLNATVSVGLNGAAFSALLHNAAGATGQLVTALHTELGAVVGTGETLAAHGALALHHLGAGVWAELPVVTGQLNATVSVGLNGAAFSALLHNAAGATGQLVTALHTELGAVVGTGETLAAHGALALHHLGAGVWAELPVVTGQLNATVSVGLNGAAFSALLHNAAGATGQLVTALHTELGAVVGTGETLAAHGALALHHLGAGVWAELPVVTGQLNATVSVGLNGAAFSALLHNAAGATGQLVTALHTELGAVVGTGETLAAHGALALHHLGAGVWAELPVVTGQLNATVSVGLNGAAFSALLHNAAGATGQLVTALHTELGAVVGTGETLAAHGALALHHLGAGVWAELPVVTGQLNATVSVGLNGAAFSALLHNAAGATGQLVTALHTELGAVVGTGETLAAHGALALHHLGAGVWAELPVVTGQLNATVSVGLNGAAFSALLHNAAGATGQLVTALHTELGAVVGTGETLAAHGALALHHLGAGVWAELPVVTGQLNATVSVGLNGAAFSALLHNAAGATGQLVTALHTELGAVVGTGETLAAHGALALHHLGAGVWAELPVVTGQLNATVSVGLNGAAFSALLHNAAGATGQLVTALHTELGAVVGTGETLAAHGALALHHLGAGVWAELPVVTGQLNATVSVGLNGAAFSALLHNAAGATGQLVTALHTELGAVVGTGETLAAHGALALHHLGAGVWAELPVVTGQLNATVSVGLNGAAFSALLHNAAGATGQLVTALHTELGAVVGTGETLAAHGALALHHLGAGVWAELPVVTGQLNATVSVGLNGAAFSALLHNAAGATGQLVTALHTELGAVVGTGETLAAHGALALHHLGAGVWAELPVVTGQLNATVSVGLNGAAFSALLHNAAGATGQLVTALHTELGAVVGTGETLAAHGALALHHLGAGVWAELPVVTGQLNATVSVGLNGAAFSALLHNAAGATGQLVTALHTELGAVVGTGETLAAHGALALHHLGAGVWAELPVVTGQLNATVSVGLNGAAFSALLHNAAGATGQLVTALHTELGAVVGTGETLAAHGALALHHLGAGVWAELPVVTGQLNATVSVGLNGAAFSALLHNAAGATGQLVTALHTELGAVVGTGETLAAHGALALHHLGAGVWAELPVVTGQLNATVSVGLNGAAFSALLHNAAGATGQLVTALHTELGAVVGTGETLAAHGALALHHLGAGVWAELPVVTGQLNATVSVGLNGAAFSALLHNAAGATGQLVTALHTELGAVVGTGETLAAHGALALHHLGAGVWAELPVVTGQLNATVSVGLNGAAFSALLHNAAGATGQLVTALHTELGAVVGTGETLAAHGALALHHLGAGVWAELPVVTGQLNATVSVGLNGSLSGLVRAGETLMVGLNGGLSGLIRTGEVLTGTLGVGLSGLAQTGETIGGIWENAAASVGATIRGALSASTGVGFTGLVKTGETVETGIESAGAELTQTGGALVRSLETALSDVELSIQAAWKGSAGFDIAA